MNYKFLSWYFQALGATLGLIACLFAYLNGYMFVYGNIGRNIDFISFPSILSCYLLFPLCIISLFLALYKSISKNNFTFKGINLNYINEYIIYVTIILGFIGARFYFFLPMIFMIFNQFLYKRDNDIRSSEKENYISQEDISDYKEKHSITLTKIQMAQNLISKNADINFIMDVTGLSKSEIENLNNK